jgi:hypothetical protein
VVTSRHNTESGVSGMLKGIRRQFVRRPGQRVSCSGAGSRGVVGVAVFLLVLLLLGVVLLVLLDGGLGDELLEDEVVALLLR